MFSINHVADGSWTRIELENDGPWIALAILFGLILFFVIKDKIEDYRIEHGKNMAHPKRSWEE